jgi:uncharacterized protein (TIGR02118 family)
MIAAISLIRRQDTVDVATFRRHWLDVHGPLVRKFAGLRHYTQCHVMQPASPHAPRIDGFPLLFFDNDADRQRAHGSAEMSACNIDSPELHRRGLTHHHPGGRNRSPCGLRPPDRLDRFVSRKQCRFCRRVTSSGFAIATKTRGPDTLQCARTRRRAEQHRATYANHGQLDGASMVQ